MKHRGGRDLAKRLAAENLRPGAREKVGIAWEVLNELNRRLILGRVSRFGQTSPYRDRPEFGSVRESVGGVRYLTGYPDRPLVKTGISLGDSLASLDAVIDLLMAVYAGDVRSTGEEQVVDAALYGAVLSLMVEYRDRNRPGGIVRHCRVEAEVGRSPLQDEDQPVVALPAKSRLLDEGEQYSLLSLDHPACYDACPGRRLAPATASIGSGPGACT